MTSPAAVPGMLSQAGPRALPGDPDLRTLLSRREAAWSCSTDHVTRTPA